ncbi:MAG: c-type cytochrome [bacterium]
MLGVLALVGAGLVIGLLVAGDDEHTATESLSADSIGDPTQGRELFVSQGCSMCHQFEGRGGEDAPPLDFMTGNLAAADIALMTGRIWNHTPAMTAAFKEEGIPFPTFQGDDMPDLIAYLHGGGPPPDVP